MFLSFLLIPRDSSLNRGLALLPEFIVGKGHGKGSRAKCVETWQIWLGEQDRASNQELQITMNDAWMAWAESRPSERQALTLNDLTDRATLQRCNIRQRRTKANLAGDAQLALVGNSESGGTCLAGLGERTSPVGRGLGLGSCPFRRRARSGRCESPLEPLAEPPKGWSMMSARRPPVQALSHASSPRATGPGNGLLDGEKGRQAHDSV